MSTQLILFPQNYNGVSSNASFSATNEYVVDGINFNGVNGASGIMLNSTGAEIITTQPPNSVNTWYKSKSNASQSYPSASGGVLSLTSWASAGLTWRSTVYQRLSSLVVGQAYDFTIDIVPGWTGQVEMYIYDDTNPLVGANAFPMASEYVTSPVWNNTITFWFLANSPNDILMLSYYNTSDRDLDINSVSITERQVTEDVFTDLQDGQVICDLYEEEDIPLTLSVDDFKNVAEKVQSYSKDFSLPETKRNNRIFNNIFEITRTDDGLIFNPYVKTKCILKQDGFLLFEGYLRLINVKEKEGQVSYNVNLYSEVVALADTLKDLTFADLNLSELDNDYTYANIKNSWTGSLDLLNPLTDPNEFAGAVGATTTDVLKYPFIDWNHQFSADPTTGFPVLVDLQSAFRPCIKLKYLIDKIFSDTNQFTYTSSFLNSTDFKNLYMDFNWGADVNPNDVASIYALSYRGYGTHLPASNFAQMTWTTCFLEWPLLSPNIPPGYDTATGIITCPTDNTTYDLSYNMWFWFVRDATLETQWLHTPASGATPTVIDLAPAITVEGGASARCRQDCDPFASGDAITGVTMMFSGNEGGYYTSVPTVTFTGATFQTGTNIATATAVCPVLPGPVTSVTMTDGGLHYNKPTVRFNNIIPWSQYYGGFSVELMAGDTLQLQMKADTADYVKQFNNQHSICNPVWTIFDTQVSRVYGTSTINGLVNSNLVNTLRGDLGQWEFFKGIMTMFNLITMVDSDDANNILIEPYTDVFIKNTAGTNLASRSIKYDWTEKVDVSQMELKPLDDLDKLVDLKFVEDDEDFVFQVFKNSTGGHLYGSKQQLADISATGLATIHQGIKEIIAEPFAATVTKPLRDDLTELLIPAVWSKNDDGTCTGFDNSPRIFYDNGVATLTSMTYEVPDQFGSTGNPTEDEFLQFTHISNPSSGDRQDFVFESTQLFGGISPPIKNLWTEYWQPYLKELYNADTRIMTLKVNLTPSDVAIFKLYDQVFIKNRVFRVNKIEYKPNALATVEFILIP